MQLKLQKKFTKILKRSSRAMSAAVISEWILSQYFPVILCLTNGEMIWKKLIME